MDNHNRNSLLLVLLFVQLRTPVIKIDCMIALGPNGSKIDRFHCTYHIFGLLASYLTIVFLKKRAWYNLSVHTVLVSYNKRQLTIITPNFKGSSALRAKVSALLKLPAPVIDISRHYYFVKSYAVTVYITWRCVL